MRNSSALGAAIGSAAAIAVASVVAIGTSNASNDPDLSSAEISAQDHSGRAAEVKDWRLPSGEKLVTANFPRNADGLTYGIDAAVTAEEPRPDLMAVISDEGDLGFLLTEDFNEEFASREAVEEYLVAMERNGGVEKHDVYAQDGKTVIGTFSTTPSSGGDAGR